MSMKMTENIEENLDEEIEYLADFFLDSLLPENEDHRNEMKNKMLKNLTVEKIDTDSEVENNSEQHIGGSNLKEYSDKKLIAENNPYVKINFYKGKTSVVKKILYCWIFDEKK